MSGASAPEDIFLSQTEQWRTIPGYEGKYEVSDAGRIRSLRNRGPNWDIARPEPLMRVLSKNKKSGYIDVSLCDQNAHMKRVLVHRLVLIAFVGPCPPGHQASHLNGERTDNRLENLAWELVPANNLRKHEHGTMVGTKSHAILTRDEVIVIRERFAAGERGMDLAKEYGLSRPTISDIVHGTTWRDVGGPISKRDARRR